MLHDFGMAVPEGAKIAQPRRIRPMPKARSSR
jgi:hypothetical protein